jgi:hypothetical protein
MLCAPRRGRDTHGRAPPSGKQAGEAEINTKSINYYQYNDTGARRIKKERPGENRSALRYSEYAARGGT